MRRITCCECKKTYDYDKDELCPRCGAYNSPRSKSTVADHSHVKGGEHLTRPAKKRRTLPPKALIGILALFLAVLIALAGTVMEASGGVEYKAHQLGSAFQVAGKQIALKNPRWVTVPEEFLAQQGWETVDGLRFLAIDLRVTTIDPEQAALAPDAVILTLPNGTRISENHFRGNASTVWSERTGLDLISLDQCKDNNGTLSGQLLYTMTLSGAPYGDAALSISELGRSAGGYTTVAEHTISFDLSDIPTAAIAVEADTIPA